MATVYVKKNESLDSALKRFKRAVKNEGILEDYKKKEYYVSKGQKARMQKQEYAKNAFIRAKKAALYDKEF